MTTSEGTQPSGACEALSSNTQLVISRTSLIEKLFGDWAILVDNSSDAIATAIRGLTLQQLDLAAYREQWNVGVKQEVGNLLQLIRETHLRLRG
ncbi:MAG: hypothetical protein HC796_04155 [Synechococcaceae cyanobacterium RL_1_2]|nr:hypothetical protein [Synechococcaceae cyanobacterium RL_1_2]